MRAFTGEARIGTIQSRASENGDVMTATQSLHLLVGAYAVNALGSAECEQFEQHLNQCSDCGDELAGLREAAGRLAEISAAVPPPGLRAKVLTRIGRTRPLPPVTAAGRNRAQSRSIHADKHRAGAIGLLALAAAIATLFALTGLTTLGQDAGISDTTARSIRDAPDAKHSLVEFDAGWSATVWHSDSLRQAVLVTENMPAPPRGTVYQLWLDQPSSGKVSAGLMPLGQADQAVVLAGDAASANGVSITLEPVGGSDQPTADAIAVFDFGRAAE